MSTTIVRKQISLFIALADWKALRQEAARQHLPMTELCRRWMEPELQKLREPSAVSTASPSRSRTAQLDPAD